MATMLGRAHDGRAGRARRARGRAPARRRRDVQRHHGGRRVLDQRLRVPARVGRVRRGDDARRRPARSSRACARWPGIWRARSCAAARARPSSSPCASPARQSDADAWLAARTIANSPLVKTAIHGGDPNWGRLVAAAGRSGAAFVLDRASVADRPGRGLRRRACRTTNGRARPPRSCRRPTSRSRSTSGPAAGTTPRCGRAISARNTCASTRSTEHEQHQDDESG